MICQVDFRVKRLPAVAANILRATRMRFLMLHPLVLVHKLFLAHLTLKRPIFGRHMRQRMTLQRVLREENLPARFTAKLLAFREMRMNTLNVRPQAANILKCPATMLTRRFPLTMAILHVRVQAILDGKHLRAFCARKFRKLRKMFFDQVKFELGQVTEKLGAVFAPEWINFVCLSEVGTQIGRVIAHL